MAMTTMTPNLGGILPRSPSPGSASPNPGPRSDVTHFIRSTDTTPSKAKPPSSANLDAGDTSVFSAVPLSPRLFMASARRLSFGGAAASSTGVPGRRSIAHSYRVLGVDQKAEEELAMSSLRSGEVDVSWPEINLGDDASATPARTRTSSFRAKGKARAGEAPPLSAAAEVDEELFAAGSSSGLPGADEMQGLADVDLEQAAASPGAGRTDTAARGLQERHAGSIYAQHTGSRLNLLRGLGLGDRSSARPLLVEDDEDDQEDLEANKERYFVEFGGRSGTMGVFGSPDGFEAVTARESAWMWISVALVSALCLVAMLISTDVIDWPGDGLGKN